MYVCLYVWMYINRSSYWYHVAQYYPPQNFVNVMYAFFLFGGWLWGNLGQTFKMIPPLQVGKLIISVSLHNVLIIVWCGDGVAALIDG